MRKQKSAYVIVQFECVLEDVKARSAVILQLPTWYNSLQLAACERGEGSTMVSLLQGVVQYGTVQLPGPH